MGLFSSIGKAVGKVAGFLNPVGSIASTVGSVAGLFGSEGYNAKDTHSAASIAASMSDKQFRQRVATAAELGIHPLAAIGAGYAGGTATPIFNESLGDRLSKAGQNIGRAVAAYQTQPQKQLTALQVERAGLENELLRAQIRQVNATSTGSPPSFPSGAEVIRGQGNAFESGSVPDVGMARTRHGNLAVVPSQDVKNRIEDMMIPEAQWYMRQLFAPSPRGYIYNPFTSVYWKPQKYSPQDFYVRARDWLKR